RMGIPLIFTICNCGALRLGSDSPQFQCVLKLTLEERTNIVNHYPFRVDVFGFATFTNLDSDTLAAFEEFASHVVYLVFAVLKVYRKGIPVIRPSGVSIDKLLEFIP